MYVGCVHTGAHHFTALLLRRSNMTDSTLKCKHLGNNSVAVEGAQTTAGSVVQMTDLLQSMA